MFYLGAFGRSSYPPGCFMHLDFLDAEKHRELGSWVDPNPQGSREALHCDSVPRAGQPSLAQFRLSFKCLAQGLGDQCTLFTESGKEGTYQVLAHHVSPMQEQQFDDFVAIEPHSIMQGAVPFLEPV